LLYTSLLDTSITGELLFVGNIYIVIRPPTA
jgi:hypothetical protein